MTDQGYEPDEAEECCACTYETKKLNKTSAPMGSKIKDPFYFCDFCYRSFAGNAAQYPEQYLETGDVMKHMCLMANIILEKLKEQP